MCLLLSGITAFPLTSELVWVSAALDSWLAPVADMIPALESWIDRVAAALRDVSERYPFLHYGTDWLAFAHIVIAVAFYGPFQDPVRNKWVIDWGLIACVGIIPLALIAGPLREIPWGWMLFDISFGVIGAIPLLYIRHLIGRLERTTQES